MNKMINLFLGAVLLAPLPATAEATGTIVDGNRRYQVKEATCFVYPKEARVEILLFDRLLNEDEQAEAMAWDGGSTMDFPSVGRISVSFGTGGLPSKLVLDDPGVVFINLGNHTMFAKDVRGSFREWSVTPKGCLTKIEFKGKDGNQPVEYQVEVKAPVVGPQPLREAPADLVKAAKEFEAAQKKSKTSEDLAPFYTSNYLQLLSERKPPTAKELELYKAFEGVREAAKREKGKQTYSVVLRPSSVVLRCKADLGGGMSSFYRHVYVKENGEWKILATPQTVPRF